jgi:hypothetical protein
MEGQVAEAYLETRIEFLAAAQNADGGWGYFPGKRSWLEPTAYAMLALHRVAGHGQALDRAWALVDSWQLADGSWRPGPDVAGGAWVTALAVTLGCVRGESSERLRRAVAWLLGMKGVESGLGMRIASHFHLLQTELNVMHEGWPWYPGNASWIEPTAHTLVALKKASTHISSRDLQRRITDGERLILSRRCRDGGWNCGNPNVLHYDLPSYPETTGLALLGLQGRSTSELAGPLQAGRRFHGETKSSLAKAWLTLALRVHGQPLETPAGSACSRDIMLAAVEGLGHPQGNYRLLTAGGSA